MSIKIRDNFVGILSFSFFILVVIVLMGWASHNSTNYGNEKTDSDNDNDKHEAYAAFCPSSRPNCMNDIGKDNTNKTPQKEKNISSQLSVQSSGSNVSLRDLSDSHVEKGLDLASYTRQPSFVNQKYLIIS